MFCSLLHYATFGLFQGPPPQCTTEAGAIKHLQNMLASADGLRTRYSKRRESLTLENDTSLKRLLSFDGGGVRGLSSLLILRDVMEEIGRQTNAAGTPLPCHYFDLIGGTSTGGLIALMLGRLEMVILVE